MTNSAEMEWSTEVKVKKLQECNKIKSCNYDTLSKSYNNHSSFSFLSHHIPNLWWHQVVPTPTPLPVFSKNYMFYSIWIFLSSSRFD
jgi:hypothetical protein